MSCSSDSSSLISSSASGSAGSGWSPPSTLPAMLLWRPKPWVATGRADGRHRRVLDQFLVDVLCQGSAHVLSHDRLCHGPVSLPVVSPLSPHQLRSASPGPRTHTYPPATPAASAYLYLSVAHLCVVTARGRPSQWASTLRPSRRKSAEWPSLPGATSTSSPPTVWPLCTSTSAARAAGGSMATNASEAREQVGRSEAAALVQRLRALRMQGAALLPTTTPAPPPKPKTVRKKRAAKEVDPEELAERERKDKQRKLVAADDGRQAGRLPGPQGRAAQEAAHGDTAQPPANCACQEGRERAAADGQVQAARVSAARRPAATLDGCGRRAVGHRRHRHRLARQGGGDDAWRPGLSAQDMLMPSRSKTNSDPKSPPTKDDKREQVARSAQRTRRTRSSPTRSPSSRPSAPRASTEFEVQGARPRPGGTASSQFAAQAMTINKGTGEVLLNPLGSLSASVSRTRA